MEFIIEIYNLLVELFQYSFGIPEGITYAIFGIKKKKKKAKKALAKANREIEAGLSQANLDSIPSDTGGNVPQTEIVDGEAQAGKDDPAVPFKPQFPYLGRQIILNSGRLHLNAADDFILINSTKSISLAAPGSVNVDTEGGFVVNAGTIKLGIGDQAEHPLVYGDVLAEILLKFTVQMQKVQKFLELSVDSSGAPISGNTQAGTALKTLVKDVDNLSQQLLSTKNFTQ